MHINDLLKLTAENGASDLHLKVGSYPIIRVNGKLRPMADLKRLMQEDTITMAFSIMSARQKQKFKDNFELDMAYSVPGLGRFRCNVFQQRGTVGLVLRVIPVKILGVRDLNLPTVLEQIAQERRGMILVTGTTGSGKSTSLAAVIDYVNVTRTEHIMTIEDPIEFLHRDKKSLINQREVEVDTRSRSPTALRSALRQDPDVILVGEMRDYETIETALNAPRPATWCSRRCTRSMPPETINRVISVFPPHQQKQIRLQLGGRAAGGHLDAAGSKRRRRRDGCRRSRFCVRRLTSASASRTRSDQADPGRDRRRERQQYGMQTFDQSLYKLLQSGTDHAGRGAAAVASNPDEFKLKVARGIQSSADMSQRRWSRRCCAQGRARGQDPHEDDSPFEFHEQLILAGRGLAARLLDCARVDAARRRENQSHWSARSAVI